MSAKVIILRGNSGSGKSTISNALREILDKNILYIEQDMLKIYLTKIKNDENFMAKRNSLIQGSILTLIDWGCNEFDYIIIDGIFKSNHYTNMFNIIKEKFSYVYAYYFDLSFEETVKRHQTRAKSKEFDADDMSEWFREKDYLTQIKEKIITKEQSKEEIVAMILADIGESI
ncbi:MAG: kinase [Clostridia bacterium]|nr:kinase [Clostridia bacterium]